jgi:hypothetical protein
MPTSNIIGYLWSQRQDLDIDGIPDLLQLVSDFQRLGLECVRIDEISIFGLEVEPSVTLIRRETEEWQPLVEEALVRASVEHTLHMLHWGDTE